MWHQRIYFACWVMNFKNLGSYKTQLVGFVIIIILFRLFGTSSWCTRVTTTFSPKDQLIITFWKTKIYWIELQLGQTLVSTTIYIAIHIASQSPGHCQQLETIENLQHPPDTGVHANQRQGTTHSPFRRPPPKESWLPSVHITWCQRYCLHCTCSRTSFSSHLVETFIYC